MNRLALFCTLLVLFSAGCTTVRSTAIFNGVNADGGRRPIETVEIQNSGWFLLTFIPIASGNPERPNKNSCCWFSNTVHLENNIKVLDEHMRRHGVFEVANLMSHCEDEKYLVFLLARRAYHTSAVLLEPLPDEKKALEQAAAERPLPRTPARVKPVAPQPVQTQPAPVVQPTPSLRPFTKKTPVADPKKLKEAAK